MVADETIDGWLDQQIESAENEDGMLRSYRRDRSVIQARLCALREVRAKLDELWGVYDPSRDPCNFPENIR